MQNQMKTQNDQTETKGEEARAQKKQNGWGDSVCERERTERASKRGSEG